jgi:hypothetical protein
MRKAILPVTAVVALAVGFVVMNATAKDKPKGVEHGNTIHVIEHADTDAVTNGSPTTDLAGNVLTFANDVFDSSDANKVGTDQGYCVRIVVGKSWECNWTTFLAGGQITVEGPFSDTGTRRSRSLAVPGSTGTPVAGWSSSTTTQPEPSSTSSSTCTAGPATELTGTVPGRGQSHQPLRRTGRLLGQSLTGTVPSGSNAASF